MKCNHCNKAIPDCRNTSNAWDHLRVAHSSLYHEAKGTTSTNKPIAAAFRLRQTISPSRLASITRKLIIFLVLGLKPLTTVLAPSFRDFCAELDPNYEPPGVDTVRDMILGLYIKVKHVVREQVHSEALSLAFGTDTWTSMAKLGYMAVSGHYLREDFTLITFCASYCNLKGSHTSQRLAEELKEVIDVYGKPCFAMASDNASNITKAIEVDLKLMHIGCAAHTLQLSIKKQFHEAFSVLNQKLHSIVAHFSRSTKDLDKFFDIQKIVTPN